MTFSPSARPQQATGNKKHQMSVTHSSLGLHSRATPGTGPEAVERLPSVAVGVKFEGVASRTKWR